MTQLSVIQKVDVPFTRVFWKESHVCQVYGVNTVYHNLPDATINV